MVGCSTKRKTCRYLGGATPLAYTGQPVFFVPNPHLAYTGKGGTASCGLSHPATTPVNENAANPTVPNTGPPLLKNGLSFNFGQEMRGGSCGACALGMMGGKHRRRQTGGNPGIPYPNGLAGTTWTPNVSSWPGVNRVPGDSNHYPLNTYTNDVSRQMASLGGNVPFNGMKGGRRRRRRTRKQKGGALSNFMAQDLINLGRQFQFGLGSAYNALAGQAGPVNPLPWKDQLVHTTRS